MKGYSQRKLLAVKRREDTQLLVFPYNRVSPYIVGNGGVLGANFHASASNIYRSAKISNQTRKFSYSFWKSTR
jgi:hypothetical protein